MYKNLFLGLWKLNMSKLKVGKHGNLIYVLIFNFKLKKKKKKLV